MAAAMIFHPTGRPNNAGDIDPVHAWKIVDGKLYLNYNRSVQKKWMQDISGYIRKADQNWPGVLQ